MSEAVNEAVSLLQSAAQQAPANIELQREVFVELAVAGKPKVAIPYFVAIVGIPQRK